MDENPYQAPQAKPAKRIRPRRKRLGWEVLIPLVLLILVLIVFAVLLLQATTPAPVLLSGQQQTLSQ